MTRYRSNFDYYAYIRSEAWQEKAYDAKQRAGWRCQVCNARGPRLDAHHRTYDRLGHELPEDITVLCSTCHAKFHDKIASSTTVTIPEVVPDHDEQLPSSITMYTLYGSYTVDTSAKTSLPVLKVPTIPTSGPVLKQSPNRDYSPVFTAMFMLVIAWLFWQAIFRGRDVVPVGNKSTPAATLSFVGQPLSKATETEASKGNCLIKGNISYNTGEKIYHVPGQKYYEQTKINTQYGERWFCSEAEAMFAGWRRAKE